MKGKSIFARLGQATLSILIWIAILLWRAQSSIRRFSAVSVYVFTMSTELVRLRERVAQLESEGIDQATFATLCADIDILTAKLNESLRVEKEHDRLDKHLTDHYQEYATGRGTIYDRVDDEEVTGGSQNGGVTWHGG